MLLLPSFLSLLFLATTSNASFRDFGIPASKATVDVRVFNVGNNHLTNSTNAVVRPVLPGHETLVVPMFSFLVEHNASNTRLMFDLGMRKDPENLPVLGAFYASGLVFVTDEERDITELLEDEGIPLDSIDAVIWSDHIGDMSKFPNSTDLIIGPGTNRVTFPGNPNATLLESDFAGHNITELDFSTANLTFSGLKAIDFFGDGSFYLLDTPGHAPGHLTALARVTPTSFIALGGDSFHHVGEARPQPQLQKTFPCPSDLLASTRTHISTNFFWSPHSHAGSFDLPSRAHPLLALSDIPGSFNEDAAGTQVSLEKVSNFDADEDIFVVIAHDTSLTAELPYFPKSLNSWKKDGLKERTVWAFVDPENPAFIFDEKST